MRALLLIGTDRMHVNRTPHDGEAPSRLVREPERFHLTQLSRTQCWRLERQGKFPKRIPISERSVAWLESEVLAWIDGRARERDGWELRTKRFPMKDVFAREAKAGLPEGPRTQPRQLRARTLLDPRSMSRQHLIQPKHAIQPCKHMKARRNPPAMATTQLRSLDR
jgi:prophage regulatory protein